VDTGVLNIDMLCLLAMPGWAPERTRASHSAVWPLKYASRRAGGIGRGLSMDRTGQETGHTHGYSPHHCYRRCPEH